MIIEEVAGDEFHCTCSCGYDEYHAASCECKDCKALELPLKACPQCGKAVEYGGESSVVNSASS